MRLLGHAGSDVETEYRTRAEIEAVEAQDPLIRSCRIVLEEGIATREDLLAMYETTRARVAAAGREASTRPPLADAEDVMAPLAPTTPRTRCAREAERADYGEARAAAFGAAGAARGRREAAAPRGDDQPRARRPAREVSRR